MADTGDSTWGHLKGTEHYGRAGRLSDYILVPKSEISNPTYSECMQAAHCMIYSRYDDKVFGIYKPRAAILMQMRFDGYIGFPGGLVDEGEDRVAGLNRELVEEMSVRAEGFVGEQHHVVTHYSAASRLSLHFYAVEVGMKELLNIERNSFDAHDHGTEALGTIRVPLYTMGDGYRGLPNFLTNSFAGNSRQQLLHSLLHLGIMTREEIELAENSKPV